MSQSMDCIGKWKFHYVGKYSRDSLRDENLAKENASPIHVITFTRFFEQLIDTQESVFDILLFLSPQFKLSIVNRVAAGDSVKASARQIKPRDQVIPADFLIIPINLFNRNKGNKAKKSIFSVSKSIIA